MDTPFQQKMSTPKQTLPLPKKARRRPRRAPTPRPSAGPGAFDIILQAPGPTISVFGDADSIQGGTLAFEYSLSQIPQAAQYTQLWNMFRINWVEIEFVPTANQSQVINATEPPGGTNPAYLLPCIHTCIDYVSSATPTSVTDVMSHSTYKRALLTKPYKRAFTGRANLAVQEIGSTTPVGTESIASDKWFSCSGPLLSFGAMKVWIDSVSSGSVALRPMLVRTYVRFSLSFKNVV